VSYKCGTYVKKGFVFDKGKERISKVKCKKQWIAWV